MPQQISHTDYRAEECTKDDFHGSTRGAKLELKNKHKQSDTVCPRRPRLFSAAVHKLPQPVAAARSKCTATVLTLAAAHHGRDMQASIPGPINQPKRPEETGSKLPTKPGLGTNLCRMRHSIHMHGTDRSNAVAKLQLLEGCPAPLQQGATDRCKYCGT
jgi:hypothetical protein